MVSGRSIILTQRRVRVTSLSNTLPSKGITSEISSLVSVKGQLSNLSTGIFPSAYKNGVMAAVFKSINKIKTPLLISHFSYPFTDIISARVSKGKHLFASPGLTCYHGPSRISFLPFHLFLWIQQRLQLRRSVGSPEPVLQGALVMGTSPGLAGCRTGKESEPQARAWLP